MSMGGRALRPPAEGREGLPYPFVRASSYTPASFAEGRQITV